METESISRCSAASCSRAACTLSRSWAMRVSTECFLSITSAPAGAAAASVTSRPIAKRRMPLKVRRAGRRPCLEGLASLRRPRGVVRNGLGLRNDHRPGRLVGNGLRLRNDHRPGRLDRRDLDLGWALLMPGMLDAPLPLLLHLAHALAQPE